MSCLTTSRHDPSEPRGWWGWVPVAIGVALALTSHDARADDACNAAYDRALDRSEASLKGAVSPVAFYTAATTCREACSNGRGSAGSVDECRNWQGDAQQRLAFATFDVRGEDGKPARDVAVSIDGGPETKIAQEPLRLDPGSHTFKFTLSTPSGPRSITVTESLSSKETKAVSGSFASTDSGGPIGPTPPPPDGKGGVPVWAWVVGGAGVAFLGTGIALLAIGVDGQNVISENCEYDEASGEYRSAKTHLYSEDCVDAVAENNLKQGIGGVFVGVGGAALIASIIGIATAPSGKPKAPNAIWIVPSVSDRFVGLTVGGVL